MNYLSCRDWGNHIFVLDECIYCDVKIGVCKDE